MGNWTIYGNFRANDGRIYGHIIDITDWEHKAVETAEKVLKEQRSCTSVYITNEHGKSRFITRN